MWFAVASFCGAEFFFVLIGFMVLVLLLTVVLLLLFVQALL